MHEAADARGEVDDFVGLIVVIGVDQDFDVAGA